MVNKIHFDSNFFKQNYFNYNIFLRKSFIIDISFNEFAIILIITKSDNILFNLFILFTISLIFFFLIKKSKIILKKQTNKDENDGPDRSNTDIDSKLIKLSVNMFRCNTVVITSIAILACDFNVFPAKHAKTSSFGIALMDVGVGYFIMCNSMRLIRNSNDIGRISNSFKK